MTHTTTESALFRPARLGPLDLPNRLVMAPLTRNRAEADGVPSAVMTTYYAQRASAGLIIAEAATPNAVGQTYPHIPGIHTPAQVAGWRRVTDAVRTAGGRMVLQLQHGGRVGHPETSGLTPVAPSPVPLPETLHTPSGRQPSVVPREMTTADIRATAADFAAAARNALDAGFEGVEVHSANGHLLHQFLAENTNCRTDAYGGPDTSRVRVVGAGGEGGADAIGPRRGGLRVSPGNTVNGIAEGDTALLYPTLVKALDDGLAYLHLGYADPDAPLFAELRRLWPGTLIANPRLALDEPPLPASERLLAAGADLIALGRSFLANPDLVTRLRTGAPLNAVREAYLMYTGGEEGYTDYPTLPAGPVSRQAAPDTDAR
ncbi:oxidoreductase [Streptomyces galbus]|uniref:Alkene reductase n=1 Tax=Streptomyces galbus TaxID=33898 RepID=A0ABX1IJJ6_STRGB|nr:alkene reductase [Streptomyces galbus]NKQ25790.1 alkene reductase [Streptomyces galbus]